MSTIEKPGAEGKEIILVRTLNASRERVFGEWTEPKHLAHWWGPRGHSVTQCELDPWPGGSIRIKMRGPDGVISPTTGVYHEVIKPERIVFTLSAFEDREGNPQLEVLTIVNLSSLNENKTRLTLRAVIVKSTPLVDDAINRMEAGWEESIDRLAEHVLIPFIH
jgi:uncharacterized protein YndB with AHSA1/START domain